MNPTLAYRVHGAEPAPWLTLSHPLGADLRIWDTLVPALAQRYRVLAVNTRGHGGDRRPMAASCTMDELAGDVQQLWAQLGIRRSHFLGLSLGGCIGASLALRAPDSVHALIVACARLEMDAATSEIWRQRASLVEQQGMAPVLTPTLERWFTPAFLAAQAADVEQVRQMLLACPPQGFAASARALAGLHLASQLPQLRRPTLFMAGRHDKAVPAHQVEHDASLVPDARFVALDGPHLLHLENPDGFRRTVLDFLAQH